MIGGSLLAFEKLYQHNANNYEALSKMRGLPVVGGFYGSRADQLAYEENQRRFHDLAKNTGIDLGRIKYPIGSGLYAGAQYPGAAMSSVNSLTGLTAGAFLYGGLEKYRPDPNYNKFPMYG